MSMRYQAGIILPGYNPLKVPNAPTIGTATGGSGSASVTFTAPADVGGGAITGYIVVSTPSSISGTGTSSPITVSGLTNGTAYTFKVFATNVYGPSPLSVASNSVTPIPAVGAAYEGGYFAGQIGVSGVATHNLVIGPVASAQSTSKQYKIVATATTGADSVIDGPANSTAMNDVTHPAALFCKAVTSGGFSDWYMPAKNELEVCYYNLKPTTASNNTGAGINANAVPARASNYTAGTPAQTSVATFQNPSGAERFNGGSGIPAYYWSSTGNSGAGTAQMQYFTMGAQYTGQSKTSSYSVRAIRRVAV
jgi:hypothetical protein